MERIVIATEEVSDGSCCMNKKKNDFVMGRYVQFAFAFMSTALVAGLVYGWPAMRKQLLEEGTDLDEKQLGAIFTVGAWSSQGGRFFAGLARDRLGTRKTAVVCYICATLGTFGLALSDANNTLALAFSFFAVGLGSGVMLCVQPVAELFPKNAANSMFLLTGAFLISGLIFLALTSAVSGSNGGRQASLLAFSAVLVILTALAWVMLPNGISFKPEKGISPKEEEKSWRKSLERAESTVSTTSMADDDEEDDEANGSAIFFETKMKTKQDSDIENVKEEERKATSPELPKTKEVSMLAVETEAVSPPTAWQQALSVEFALLCLWFSVCVVPLQYYVGSIGFQLERKGDDTGFYTDLFSIIYASTSVVAPLAGYLVDQFGLGISQGVATAATAASLAILALDEITLNAHVLGMLFYGIARLYVYSTFFSNIGKRFGYTNFGTLSGVGLVVSAIISLVQYPLIALSDDGHDVAVNVGCVIALLALEPYCIWLFRREKKVANDSLKKKDDPVLPRGLVRTSFHLPISLYKE
eukprot:scaffold4927_cov139-Amphora_coffeaeformis.AAC.17